MKHTILTLLILSAMFAGFSAKGMTDAHADCKQNTATNNQHVQAGRAYTQIMSLGCNQRTIYQAEGSDEDIGILGAARTTLYTTNNGATYHLGQCPAGNNDADGDGYSNAVDCDDHNAAIHPGATDVCGDDIDQNCDGADPACAAADNDGDGYAADADCDDHNADIHPGAMEVCGDGIDQNCDGADLDCTATDNDGDGYSAELDCNDNDANIHPDAFDFCGDGIDQNCDGDDTACLPAPSCITDLNAWKLKYAPNNANCIACHTTCTPGGTSGRHSCPEGGSWSYSNCTGCHRSVH